MKTFQELLTRQNMDKYDEYKYFGELVLQQSQRRQNASQAYLTVNTAIFGIMMLLLKDSGLHGWILLIANLPLFLVGFMACMVWLTIIARYKQVIGWYYEQLRNMENELTGSFKFYTKEWISFYERSRSSFSDLEAFMPKIFIGLYIAYMTGMILAVKYDLL
jgi:hypothetical protein